MVARTCIDGGSAGVPSPRWREGLARNPYTRWTFNVTRVDLRDSSRWGTSLALSPSAPVAAISTLASGTNLYLATYTYPFDSSGDPLNDPLTINHRTSVPGVLSDLCWAESSGLPSCDSLLLASTTKGATHLLQIDASTLRIHPADNPVTLIDSLVITRAPSKIIKSACISESVVSLTADGETYQRQLNGRSKHEPGQLLAIDQVYDFEPLPSSPSLYLTTAGLFDTRGSTIVWRSHSHTSLVRPHPFIPWCAAAATRTGALEIYDLRYHGNNVIQFDRAEEHYHKISSMCWSPHSCTSLFTASLDGSLKLWNLSVIDDVVEVTKEQQFWEPKLPPKAVERPRRKAYESIQRLKRVSGAMQGAFVLPGEDPPKRPERKCDRSDSVKRRTRRVLTARSVCSSRSSHSVSHLKASAVAPHLLLSLEAEGSISLLTAVDSSSLNHDSAVFWCDMTSVKRDAKRGGQPEPLKASISDVWYPHSKRAKTSVKLPLDFDTYGHGFAPGWIPNVINDSLIPKFPSPITDVSTVSERRYFFRAITSVESAEQQRRPRHQPLLWFANYRDWILEKIAMKHHLLDEGFLTALALFVAEYDPMAATQFSAELLQRGCGAQAACAILGPMIEGSPEQRTVESLKNMVELQRRLLEVQRTHQTAAPEQIALKTVDLFDENAITNACNITHSGFVLTNLLHALLFLNRFRVYTELVANAPKSFRDSYLSRHVRLRGWDIVAEHANSFVRSLLDNPLSSSPYVSFGGTSSTIHSLRAHLINVANLIFSMDLSTHASTFSRLKDRYLAFLIDIKKDKQVEEAKRAQEELSRWGSRDEVKTIWRAFVPDPIEAPQTAGAGAASSEVPVFRVERKEAESAAVPTKPLHEATNTSRPEAAVARSVTAHLRQVLQPPQASLLQNTGKKLNAVDFLDKASASPSKNSGRFASAARFVARKPLKASLELQGSSSEPTDRMTRSIPVRTRPQALDSANANGSSPSSAHRLAGPPPRPSRAMGHTLGEARRAGKLQLTDSPSLHEEPKANEPDISDVSLVSAGDVMGSPQLSFLPATPESAPVLSSNLVDPPCRTADSTTMYLDDDVAEEANSFATLILSSPETEGRSPGPLSGAEKDLKLHVPKVSQPLQDSLKPPSKIEIERKSKALSIGFPEYADVLAALSTCGPSSPTKPCPPPRTNHYEAAPGLVKKATETPITGIEIENVVPPLPTRAAGTGQTIPKDTDSTLEAELQDYGKIINFL